MKKIIDYYYKINSKKIKKTEYGYLIETEKDKYYLYKIENNEYINLTINNNLNIKKMHSIILNINNELVTNDGNDNYVLMKINIDKNNIVDMKDVFKFNKIEYINYQNKNDIYDWKTLWERKTEYMNNYILNNDGISSIIKSIIIYLDGLSQTAIKYLEYANSKNVREGPCHIRINKNESMYDLYNPFNIIIDKIPRDISEYIKNNETKENIIYEMKQCINDSMFNRDEYVYLIARLIYPTIYYDKLETLIKKDDIESLKEICDQINKHEYIIKELIKVIIEIKKIDIPTISWLSITDQFE